MGHKRAKRSVRESNRQKAGTDRVPTNHDQMEHEKLPKNAMRILMSAQTREDYRKRKREEAEGGGGGKKSGAVVANSESTGQRQKKAKPTAGTSSKAASSSKLTILPGESLIHFNRRVEDSLRSSVASASKTAQQHATDIARQEREDRETKHATRQAELAEKKAAKEKETRKAERRAARKKERRAAAGKTTDDEDSEGEDEDDEDDDDSEEETEAKKVATVVDKGKAKADKEKSLADEFRAKSKPKGKTDFEKARSSSAPKRLNDIAMAPPSLTLPRLASKAIAAHGGHSSVAAKLGLSAAQSRILEEERERVILRYRELKERKGIKQAILDGSA